MMQNLKYCLIFAICASLAWWGITPFTTFFMFVPLFILQKKCKGKGFMPYVLISFILWNSISLWWIGKATILGPVAANLVFLSLFGTVMALYNKVWKVGSRALAYTLLVSLWVAAEWFYLYNKEISFPWLNLGNSFGITPWAVQWYEYCGALGGSVWVLVVNIMIFEAIERCSENGKFKFRFPPFIVPFLAIILPLSYSLYTYFSYSHPGKEVKCGVLQLNVDPYGTQFGSTTTHGAEYSLLKMANETDEKVDFFVASETALEDDIWINFIESKKSIRSIKSFLKEKQPSAAFITGAVTKERYLKSQYKSAPTFTARDGNNLPFYYDVFNSALFFDTTSIEVYNKSRLVIGVEMMPFHRYFSIFGDNFVNLGETFGMFGSQSDSEIFTNPNCDVKVGSAICYESIYGGYFSSFVQKGAQIMFIITNDGWWGNTPGYRQHLSFASLRAIETRREIARSANTGISAIIDARGKIKEHTEWQEKKMLVSELKTNDQITFYVKYGDFVGRIAAYIAALCLLFSIAYKYKRKDHLSYENFNKYR